MQQLHRYYALNIGGSAHSMVKGGGQQGLYRRLSFKEMLGQLTSRSAASRFRVNGPFLPCHYVDDAGVKDRLCCRIEAGGPQLAMAWQLWMPL